MNWITTDYEFGIPIQGVKFSGGQLLRAGIGAHDIFDSKEKVELIFTLIKHCFPSDARLVRIAMPHDQDAVIFYTTSKAYEVRPVGDYIEVVGWFKEIQLSEDSETIMSARK